MRKVICCVALLLISASVGLFCQSNVNDLPRNAKLLKSKLGGCFVENKGQWANDVLFMARANGMNAWITRSGVVFDYYKVKRSAKDAVENGRPGEFHIALDKGFAMEMKLNNPACKTIGEDALSSKENYLTSAGRFANVARYARLKTADAIRGITTEYCFDKGNLRYNFIVAPGANPDLICLDFRLGSDPSFGKVIESGKKLRFNTPIGDIFHSELMAYQVKDGSRQIVECDFIQRPDGKIGFSLGIYDRNLPLIIDPLVYSTLLGNSSENYANAIANDASGCAYVAGHTYSNNFPTTLGAYDESFNGTGVSLDIFVAKLNAAGSALEYSTYIGGTNDEWGYGIAVDASGCAYVTGSTQSNNFPTTAGAFDVTFNAGDYDVFVSKLSSNGSQLEYSTFLGGSASEEAFGIAVNQNGEAYVAGKTGSANFPVTAGAFDTDFNGVEDAFVARLNASGTALVFSSFLGGLADDCAKSVAIDASGNVFVAGETSSNNFPTTTGAFDQVYNQSTDAFVAKLNPSGSSLVYSTYVGGSLTDAAEALAVDASGNAYLTGYTTSTNFPVTPGALFASRQGTADAFVTKLNATGTSLSYSTYLGGSGGENGTSIAVDGAGCAIVAGGLTSSPNFPTTADAFDQTANPYRDAFLTKFNNTGTGIVYSTFFGGNDYDEAWGISLDQSGNIYMTGWEYSNNFPTTAGAFDQSFNGFCDVFVAKFSFGAQAPQGDALQTLPLDGATNVSIGDTLYWSVPSGAEFTNLQIATDPSMSGIIEQTTLSGTKFQLKNNSYPVVYWRVQAGNTGGTSNWSPVWSLGMKPFKVDLHAGWNAIATCVDPDAPTRAEIAGKMNNVFAAKDANGKISMPAFAIYGAEMNNLNAAIQIFSIADDSLDFRGTLINTDTVQVQLRVGWNLVPFPKAKPATPQAAFASILSNILIIMNQNGELCVPSESVNTLEQGGAQQGMIAPGKAYAIYVSQPCTLSFPAGL